MTAVYPSTYRKRLYAGSTGLIPSEIAVLSLLAHLASTSLHGGWFNVDQEEMADRSGVSSRHIRRLMPGLQAKGWIEVRVEARNGHYRAFGYRLALPRQPDTMSDGPADTMSGHRGHHVQVQVGLEADIATPVAADTMSERVRSYSRESDSQRPSAAKSPTPSPQPETETPDPPARPGPDGPGYQPDWRNPPPKNPATTSLLDDLGVRRRKAQR